VSDISPDLVVIQQGLNDVWTRTTSAPIQSDFSNYRKAWSRPIEKYSFFSKDRPIISALTLTGIQNSMFLVYTLRRIGYTLSNYQHYDEEQGKMTNILSVGALVNHSDIQMDEKYLTRNSSKYFERNTRYMIGICRAMGAEVLLVTEPYTEKAGKARNIAMPQHNALLANIAREESVLFYDFAKDMMKDDVHMPDGKHMSQIGSDLKRDLFFEYFLKQEIIPKLRTVIQSRGNIAHNVTLRGRVNRPAPLPALTA